MVRERAGAQWVASTFLPKAVRDLFDTDDDDDDANARFDLATQLELRNQSKSTIFK